uniref:Death domain-containing protein n=1 Tax=Amphimedon queenslandica TaxID=400682 RepID=A0A1X7VEG7_AMPQE
MDRDSEVTEVFTRPASKEITEKELSTMSMFIVLEPHVLASQLHIPTAVWSCIRQDNIGDRRAMIREILLTWLKSYPGPTPTFSDLYKLMSTGFELSEYDEDNDTVTLKRSPEKKRLSKTEEEVGHIQRKVSDLTITEILPHKKKRGSPEKDQIHPVSGDENEVHIIVKRGTEDHYHHSEENSPTKRAKKEKEGNQTKIEIYLSARPRKPLAVVNL